MSTATSTKQQMSGGDPGLLRAELAELYTQLLMPMCRARWARSAIARISRMTGISREQVIANVLADAEQIRLEAIAR